MTAARDSIPFDRIADDYDRTRGGEERGGAVAAAIEPLLPAGPVLEVGVGTGLVAVGLVRGGRDVVGVDLSLPMLRYARGRVPGRMVAGDALRLPIRSGAVAGVVMIHVLHVVGDIPATLAEAARVLRPGGRIVVSAGPLREPNSDVSGVVGELGRRLGFDGVRPDDEVEVVAAAAAIGLTVADRSTYPPQYAEMSPADWIYRIDTRSASWMWSLDEDAWQRAAAPTRTALRALPDQDRPRRDAVDVPLLAFTPTR